MLDLDRTLVSGVQKTLLASGQQTTLVGADGARQGTGPEPPELARGNSIGRYVVLQVLGAGGMGVVYAAYDPELDRKVAIKLLHAEVAASASTQGATRLLREAQAMARLSHPNVIAVHDVGTHAGQVFMAMEFIEGHTLGDELAARPRSWREVVALYAAAGRGLAAAHRSGVIHRDFKPDNVMIDREGRVRVLDFGLAHAPGSQVAITGGEGMSSLDMRLTATGAVMGTPAYMAPEQHLGRPTDERSDQFSLCVALYEGIYGERPYAGDNLASLALEVTQGKVREPPPGTRVPGRVRRALLRGLSQAPAQRYPDMQALLAELERDPARQRRGWGAAALVALLLGGAGVGVQQLLSARAQVCNGSADQMVGVWDDARRQAVHAAFTAVQRPFAAAAWADVSRQLDAYTQAWVAMRTEACTATRIRGEQSEELLDRRMSCLQRQLDRVRIVIDGLTTADAVAVERSVEVVAKLPELEQCADLEALMDPVERPGDAAAADQVAALRQRQDQAYVLYQLGKHELAAEQTRALLVESRALGFRPQLAELLLNYGQIQNTQGVVKEAEASLDEAILTAQAGRHDRIMASALVWLVGNLSLGQNRFAEAHKLARHAQAAIDRLGGNNKLQAELKMRLAITCSVENRKDEAGALGAEALALAERTYGADHLLTADFITNNATLAKSRKRFDEAEALYRRALRIWHQHLGEQHPKLGGVHTNLGVMYIDLEREAEAEQELRAALAIYEKTLAPDHPELGITLLALARLLMGQEREAEAEVLGLRALGIFEAKFGKLHRNVLTAHFALARAQRQLGRLDESQAHLDTAIATAITIYGPEHTTVAGLIDALAYVYLAKKDYPRALAEFRRTLAMYEKLDATDPGMIEPLLGTGESLIALKKPAGATAPLERALAWSLVMVATDVTYTPAYIATIRWPLARALWAVGERPRALKEARAAREAWAAAVKGYGKELAAVTAWLAERDR